MIISKSHQSYQGYKICRCSNAVTFLLLLISSSKRKPASQTLSCLNLPRNPYFFSFYSKSLYIFSLRACDGSVKHIFRRRLRYFGSRSSHTRLDFFTVSSHPHGEIRLRTFEVFFLLNLTFFDPLRYMVYFLLNNKLSHRETKP